MVLNIIKFNNDTNNFLRRQNIDVKNNEHNKKLISDMFETLTINGGVGLAAPQVGKNLNLFIVSYQNFTETFINPKIIAYGHSTEMKENCLSVPNIPVIVTRKGRIKIEYYDKNWIFKHKEFEGIFARIIQHEYDHTIGKLILDY